MSNDEIRPLPGTYDQFLTSDKVITIAATMPDGSKHDTHWKKCSHVDFERWRTAEQSGDAGKIERAKQLFIAACLVNPSGDRALSEKESIKLTAEGVATLFPLALEASGIVKRPDPKGDSPDGDGSM